jgi:hypothetical protein
MSRIKPPADTALSRLLPLWIAGATLFCGGIAQAQEGYRLLADQVLVDTEAHWRAWESPIGVRTVHPDGTVEPRFLRRDINAALNAGQFRYISEGDTLTGGIFAAGSNRELAPLVIDGDADTCWEPELDRPVDDWWIDIDLGRAVIAQRIVVRFAEEGDPLLKFRVLISDGRITFTQERNREFFRVGLANQPNKTQREFVFELEPQGRVPEGLIGAVAQIVRIQALGSDGPRGAEIDSRAYLDLPPEERGAIDHFRRTRAGRQIRVEQDIYEALPPEEQGSIRHYRREHPRLAEVEVIALGDNAVRLTRQPLESRSTGSVARRLRPYTDGLFSTFSHMLEYDPLRDENQLQIDLGAKYWLERIRLLSPAEPPPAYQIRVSDGALNPDGELIWRLFDERLNREGYLQVEEPFAIREVRYIDLRRLELVAGNWEKGQLSEIQAYGEGYVSEVVMISPLIRLHRSVLFATLSWEGERPRNTRIEVRSRSGDKLLRIPHYYTSDGREISKTSWERRARDDRLPVVIEELPGSDWSNWSGIYHESGQPFKSPSPRRYALFEVRLHSSEPLRAPRIRQLRLHFTPPLTDQAFAELWPVRGVEPGQEEEFTLYVQPQFGAGNPGFDRIRLRSSSAEELELVSVRSGTESLLRQGAGLTLWPGRIQVEHGDEGALDLVFPAPVEQGILYVIRFRTRIFLGNTLFSAYLAHGDFPERVQQISAGDATGLAPSQSLVAVADLGDVRLLDDVAVVPPTFTPNGDGINDRGTIQATIFAVEGAKHLQVEIYDLSGRCLRDLSVARLHPSGQHRVSWDGRDQEGRLVPPGIYAVRLGFATDARLEGTRTMRLVHVVY